MDRENRLPRGSMWKMVATAALGLAVSFGALASPSNKWRAEMSGKAKVDGEIELSVVPVGGTATNVVIAIPKKTGENTAARIVRDTLRQTFGTDVYHVEVDDGEDVLVKAHGSTPHFDLIVVRNTADGLRIHLQHE